MALLGRLIGWLLMAALGNKLGKIRRITGRSKGQQPSENVSAML